MYIELYADVLFLICLIPEFLSLWLLTRWRNSRIRIRRVGGVSLLAAGMSVTTAVVLRTAGMPVLLTADLMIQLLSFRMLFGKRGISRDLEDWIFQKLLFVGMGGLLQAGWRQKRADLAFLLAGFLAGGCLLYRIIRSLQKKKQLESVLYQAELQWRNQNCRCMALLDTGNQLYYGADAPVVLISPEIAEQLKFRCLEPDESCRMIPYTSVGCTSGLLYGFVCDWLTVTGCRRNRYEKVVVGVADHPLSGNGDYQMLLHPALFEKQ